MIREVEKGSTVIDQFPVFEDDGYTKKSGLLPGDFTPSVFLDAVVDPTAVTIAEIGSTGEYKATFPVASTGLYEVQVFVPFSKEIWYGQYVCVDELTNDLAAEARNQTVKIDQAVVDNPPADGSLYDQLANKDASQTFDPAFHSLEAISDALAASSGDTSISLTAIQADLSRVLGLLHRNAILDKQEYDSQDQLTFARLRVFDSVANLPTTPGGSETVGLLHEYEINAEYDGLNIVKKFTLKQLL